MSVGQLWYTWTEQGREGSNQFQIVAASGALGDRRMPLTQAILRACYGPAGATLTWEQIGAAVIVSMRTPVTISHAGRATEAFFAHILAGTAGDFPLDLLPRLVGASGWVPALPDHLEPVLAPVEDLTDFGLMAAIEVPDEVFERLSAVHLGHVLEGAPSSLDLPPALVATMAARISELLPSRFGLVSFCSNPVDAQVGRFALVAGAPVGPARPLHGPTPAPALVGVVRLLVAARDGSTKEQHVVNGIDALSTSLADFIRGLAHWSLVDRRPDLDDAQDIEEALAFVNRNASLVEALISGDGVWTVAAGVALGMTSAYAALLTASNVDRLPLLEGPVLDRLSSMAPSAATLRLGELSTGAPREAGHLARRLVARWQEGNDLAAVDSQTRLALLHVVARGSHQPGRTLDAVLDAGTALLVVLDAPDLPVTWRTRALAAFPRSFGPDAPPPPPVPGTTLFTDPRTEPRRARRTRHRKASAGLGAVLVEDAAFTRALTGLLEDPVLFTSVMQALDTVDPRSAHGVIGVLRPGLTIDQQDVLALAAFRRLPSTDALDLLPTELNARTRVDNRWGELIADSIENALLSQRHGTTVEVDFRRLHPVFSTVWSPSERVNSWATITGTLSQMQGSMAPTSDAVWQVARASNHFNPEIRTSLAMELVRRISRTAYDYRQWRSLIDTLGRTGLAATTGWSVVLEATSFDSTVLPADKFRRSGRYWAAIWFAQQCAAGELTKADARSRAVAVLAEHLTPIERTALGEWAKGKVDAKASRAVRKYILHLPVAQI